MDKIEKLDQLISEVLGGGKLNLELVTEEESPVKSGEQTERRVLRLPQYRVSETWGDPKSEDRVVISRFMAQVPGENLQEKFNSLSNFITKCKEECVREKDTPKIIPNIIPMTQYSFILCINLALASDKSYLIQFVKSSFLRISIVSIKVCAVISL